MHRAVRRPGVLFVVILVGLLVFLASGLPGSPGRSGPVPAVRGPAPGGPLAPASPRASAVADGPVTVAPGYRPPAGVDEAGAAPAQAPMSVLVALASQDAAGLEAEVSAEYTPGSGTFHHYLSPTQVADRYGASPTSVSAAVAYFGGFGLATQVLGGDSLVSVSGATAAVAAAFGTSFEEYRAPGGRTFVSHPTPATLPGGIPWTGAIGLGNTTQPIPLAAPSSGSLAPDSPLGRPLASCTSGTYGLSPCQIWGAYNSSSLISNGTNGTGERIGIVDVYDGTEPQSQLASDLASFDSTFHLPAASVSYNYPVRTSQDLNSTSPGWALEEGLDLEWAHASAPGASIAMTFGTNSNAGLYEAVDWLVSNHRVDVITLSWGEPDVGIYNAYAAACTTECNASTDGSYEVLGPVLAAAALEGITVFAASGDCGSADGTSGVSTNFPASDPYVTGVGGTQLSVSSSGVYQGEIAWSGNSSGARSPGCQNGGGAGGGYAPFSRPWWQSGTGLPSSPSSRGVPDVSADASTGVEVIVGGGPGGVGGTSLASPLWAGFAAIADQAVGTPLGFLNPQLYDVLRGSNYSSDLHDITSGGNGYRAGTGWDAVTGIGTPRLDRLVADLAHVAERPSSLAVSLTAQPLHGSAPLDASFTLRPTGGSRAYTLEGVYFGDGTAALAPSGAASHRYLADGVYPAVGYVVDSSGNTSASDPVAVVVGGSALSVNLSASPADPAVGAAVRFTATVNGGTAPYTYLFTFGDGGYLNDTLSASTSHAFPVAGGFCANVVVIDAATPADGGTSAEVPVAVGGAAAPTCPDQTSPLTVNATGAPAPRDAPADFPALFEVTGGNGAVSEQLSSTDPYVAACECTIFRSAGTYPVTLTAVDGLGDRASDTTNVSVAPPLTAGFAASTQAGPAPLTVDFRATASGGYLATAALTHWQFGDGTGAVGATASHTFQAPGLYFATADLEDAGSGNASEAFLIDVSAPGSPVPTLTATIAPAVNVTSGTLVSFSAATNDSAASPTFRWSLGGGLSAGGADGSATLYPPGAPASRNLSVRLGVTLPASAAGAPPTSLEAVFNESEFFAIEPGSFVPSVNALRLTASGGPSAGVAPVRWAGTAAASGPGPRAPTWLLANGTTADGPSASETFGTDGTYTVVAQASDAWNDTARLPFMVSVTEIFPAIELSANVTPTSGGSPLAVRVMASATGGAGAPYDYNWSFGDGGRAGTATAQHTYTSPGTYQLSLVVTDPQGNTARLYWTVNVTAPASGPTNPPSGISSALLLEVVAAAVIWAGVGAFFLARRRRPPAAPPTP